MDREAWCAVIRGVEKSQTWLSDSTELNWMLYCITITALHNTILHYTILFYSLLYILHYTVLYHTIAYYTTLYSIIPLYSILYCSLIHYMKDGDVLYSQQKQDQEQTVAQTMNSLLPNSDLNWGKQGKPLDHSGMTQIKSLRIIVSEELWTEVHDIVQEAGIKTIPKEKKY